MDPDKCRFYVHEALEDIETKSLCGCRGRGGPSLSKPVDSSHDRCDPKIDFWHKWEIIVKNLIKKGNNSNKIFQVFNVLYSEVKGNWDYLKITEHSKPFCPRISSSKSKLVIIIDPFNHFESETPR